MLSEGYNTDREGLHAIVQGFGLDPYTTLEHSSEEHAAAQWVFGFLASKECWPPVGDSGLMHYRTLAMLISGAPEATQTSIFNIDLAKMIPVESEAEEAVSEGKSAMEEEKVIEYKGEHYIVLDEWTADVDDIGPDPGTLEELLGLQGDPWE